MIATILPGSTNFHAVGYNEHKVSKGLARLIEMKNFGALGIVRPPTTDDKIDFLKNTVLPTTASKRRSSM